MNGRRITLFVLALGVAVGLGIYAGQQIPYDQCLDLGGRIDYTHRLCVTEEGEYPLREFVLRMIGVSVFALVFLPLAVFAAFRALRSRAV